MRDIRKTFAHIVALARVSLTAYRGEVHALMGENGAGKSTLMKVLSGAYKADPGGSIQIDGKPVTIDGPQTARALGIAVIYQELSLAPNLTVAENIFLGREQSKGGFTDRTAQEAACAAILKRLHVRFRPSTRVGTLSLGERQLVEIARALMSDARILVMDEPTTSLSTRETEHLFRIIRDLKAEGIAILYISHRMEEIYELSDRVSVLRDGAYVGTLMRKDLSAERLVSMMVGRDLSSFYRKAHTANLARDVLLEVRDIADDQRVHGCSFDLHAGEVLGVAGLVGAGRTELARLIYGADPKSRGTVTLAGQKLDIRGPQDSIDAGIVYLTEDRKGLGLFLDMTIRENVSINVAMRDALALCFTNFAAARARAAAAMKTFAVRAGSASVHVGALSGGNQQKVLLARLLETKPRILILDEPTRGIDVGAKSEIYRLIDQLAASGIGIVVISSELPEIIGIADRVMVVRDGRIAGFVTASAERPITQEDVMKLSTGTRPAEAA
ncbi:sugar ABC transporter ATP-binding protein [Kaistia terrae]|uniref:Sugar ABC transporter ATP-binding protein n=1 Tax=Kaistia terrae TaxID=537017 RepID=A0ABW0PXN5_9HYPH|nr:sugar ABC transporter ATP-binding protein [Kaistia terrae]MCX5579437.1 sugar ABC transporter ATP-binding protein [Kaistia terrae]